MKIILNLILIFYQIVLFAQSSDTCVTLKPGSDEGFDAEVWSLEPISNFGDHDELRANAWTWSGDFGIQRSFFRFNLDTIPDSMVLVSAELNLFGLDDPDTQLHSGDNESYIRRVTEEWEEFDINWDNQPSTTNINQVLMDEAAWGYEDFTDINVTELVEDMLDFGNYGFMLRLQEELTYRRLGFASSDHENSSSYPELILCWEKMEQKDTVDTEFPSDSCLLLKPGPETGFDAEVWSLEATTNFGDHDELRANAWTWSGDFGIQRSFIKFNLDTIPDDMYVESAELSFYGLDDPDTQLHSGENDAFISRVTEDWDEYIITWDNQPLFTEINQLEHEPAASGYEDFIGMNVTEMVRDMVDFGNYGFVFHLQNEAIYRRLGFASSDHTNSDSYPELLLCLTSIPPEDTTVVEMPSDTCIVLKPNSEEGIDAEVWSLDPNTNFGTHEANRVDASIWNGELGIHRSFLKFDLNVIPDGATLVEANLNLYALDEPDTQHHVGENQSFIRQVIEDWDENLITWDNQPAVTATNQVVLDVAGSEYEDYLDINVKLLVQEMLETDNFGFMIRLEDETANRRLGFASSDHENDSSYPELELCYNFPVEIEQVGNTIEDIKLYPNPTTDYVILETQFNESIISIISIQGVKLVTFESKSQTKIIDVNNLPKGTYIIQVIANNAIYNKIINII